MAHAMASDFSVTWQFLSRKTIGFLLQIKLHALKNNLTGSWISLAVE
jgi:hypothetical protein